MQLCLHGDGTALVQAGFRSVGEQFPGLGIEGEQCRFLEMLDVDGNEGPCPRLLVRLSQRDGHFPVRRPVFRRPVLFGPAAGKAQDDPESSKKE